MYRPQSGVVWLRRSAIAHETMQDLAHGRIPCSHAAMDAFGADAHAARRRAATSNIGGHGYLPTGSHEQLSREGAFRSSP
jgi:hypothetical protein